MSGSGSLPVTIAIDGPAASGKSTVAEKLASELGYLYFDTGVMYRAVTWAALQRLGGVDDEQAVSQLAHEIEIDVRPPTQDDGRRFDVLLDGQDVTWDIRAQAVDVNVSIVSAYAQVRQSMTGQQRRIGQQGQIVMVGRDIGTVVLPQADLKIYLDASVEQRAKRRFEELVSRGESADFEAILCSMRERDRIDSTRHVAPLKPAADAVIINTSDLPVSEVLVQIRQKLAN